ncbi:hypothetical protein FACS1894151_09040 [Spirochaetia bacterium]|nr:hypothetical protein FACS1894151_09040 [Spirochaetia bacterium]
MKMKLLVFILIIPLIPLHLTAQEQSAIKLNVVPLFGWINGQGEEIVYRDEGSKDKLSQLLWNMDSLFYLGAGFELNWQKPENKWGLSADAAFKYGFPSKNGLVEDRDWESYKYTDWLTRYSVHNNQTKNAVLFNANFGFEYILPDIVLKAFLAYDYMSFSWAASGGYLLYPIYEDGSEGHGYFINQKLEVGNYKQSWHIISPALSFYGTINDYFNTEIALKASPFIWCFARDNHLLRSMSTTETMQWGFFIEPKLVFSFTPKYFTLSFSVLYRNISNTRGNGRYAFSDGSYADFSVKDMMGSGYSAFDIGIMVKINIGNF